MVIDRSKFDVPDGNYLAISQHDLRRMDTVVESALSRMNMGVMPLGDVKFTFLSGNKLKAHNTYHNRLIGYLTIPHDYVDTDLPEEERDMLMLQLTQPKNHILDYRPRYFSVKSGIQQSTGMEISFGQRLIKRKNEYIQLIAIQLPPGIGVKINKGDEVFNLGRFFLKNPGNQITGDTLNKLCFSGGIFPQEYLDGQRQTQVPIATMRKFLREKLFWDGDPVSDIYASSYNEWTSVMLHIPYEGSPKRITADLIDLPNVARIKARNRDQLDAVMRPRNFDPSRRSKDKDEYLLLQTIPVKIPDYAIGLVSQDMGVFLRTGRYGDIGEHALSPYYHLPSVIIDSGWNGPIRAEMMLRPGVEVPKFMMLEVLAQGMKPRDVLKMIEI